MEPEKLLEHAAALRARADAVEKYAATLTQAAQLRAQAHELSAKADALAPPPATPSSTPSSTVAAPAFPVWDGSKFAP